MPETGRCTDCGSWICHHPKPPAFTLAPAPGVTLEEMQAQLARARKVGLRRPTFPTDGPTARWVVPAGPPAVVCPTCDAAVNLSEWWSHGCKSVPLCAAGQLTLRAAGHKSHTARPLLPRRAVRKVAAKLAKTWNGDVPTSCNHCGSTTVRNGFADAPLSNGRTWGILCGRF